MGKPLLISMSAPTPTATTTTTTATMSTSAQDLGIRHHPFDMGSLKTHLPKKRKGLSRYFSSKSKSFTCLGDAKCIDDLEKTDIPEIKRRKYLDRKAAANHSLVFCSTEMSSYHRHDAEV